MITNSYIQDDYIFRYEPYFDSMVKTAYLDHVNKEVRPCHGYFIPNPYGKLNEDLANTLGYRFNNGLSANNIKHK
jgi:hypothetical protein